MGYAIGTVTGGSGDEAHYKVLAAIRTLAMANGWTVLRYVDTGLVRELILNSAGLSGAEDIYIGFRTYQSVPADYYNLLVGTFTGYVPGNSFDTQPGAALSGVPCHNNAVTYFMTANAQRIVGCFKVGTPVYTHFYAGKMFPYSRPGEYPSPLVCGGNFSGAAAKRFSDGDFAFPYFGRESGYASTGNSRPSYCFVRDQAGTWRRLSHWPFYNGAPGGQGSVGAHALASVNYLSGSSAYRALVPAGTNYQPQPIVLYNGEGGGGGGPAVFGELDGVFQMSGFNNAVENVVQVGGAPVDQTGLSVLQAVDAIRAGGNRAFVMLQDTNNTDWRSFVAVEMS